MSCVIPCEGEIVMRNVGVVLISLIGGLMIGVAVAYACSWPPIDIDSPGGGVVLMGTTEVKATVDEEVKFESVEFFANDESIGKDDEAPYSVKWDTTTVENGEYELTAVGTPSEGEKVKSKIVTVTVENPKDS